MKKIIFFILVVCLSAAAFTGCAAGDGQLPQLSERMEARIKEDWEREHLPYWTLRFYGKDNGYYILAISAPIMIGVEGTVTDTIADEQFTRDVATYLAVYKDGRFYSLKEAYNASYVSAKAIARAAAIHAQYETAP